MAHELEIRDGKASFFSVRETAWHQLGTILPDAPSFDDALALIRADYGVKRVPLYVPRYNPNGESFEPVSFVESTLSAAVVRTDTMAELGRVTPSYEPVSNRDAFQAITPLLDAGVARLETGGVLRDGATAWLLAQFDLAKFGPVVQEVFGGPDAIVPFGLLRADHSGSGANYCATTPVRVVCANTLAAAEMSMNAIRIPHVSGAALKTIRAAETLFGGLVERFEQIATGYKILRALTLDPAEFERDVLDAVAPDPRKAKDFNPEAKLAELVVERALAKREIVRVLWTSGKGHTGDASAWEAYNGAVEAIDHTDTFPTRPGAAWKVAGLIDGKLASMKATVYRNLLKTARTRGVDGAREALSLAV